MDTLPYMKRLEGSCYCCPWCDTHNEQDILFDSRLAFDPCMISVRVTCIHCRGQWIEYYKLKDVQLIHEEADDK